MVHKNGGKPGPILQAELAQDVKAVGSRRDAGALGISKRAYSSAPTVEGSLRRGRRWIHSKMFHMKVLRDPDHVKSHADVIVSGLGAVSAFRDSALGCGRLRECRRSRPPELPAPAISQVRALTAMGSGLVEWQSNRQSGPTRTWAEGGLAFRRLRARF